MLPVFNTASLAGFGAVVAALPAFSVVSEALLTVPGGPLVSLAVAASVMAAITGSASAALIITLDTFGQTLADFQNTRFKLAECATLAHVVRSFVNDCIQRQLDGTEHDFAVHVLLARNRIHQHQQFAVHSS